MKILITGVAGLLGSRLTDYIIENHPEAKVVGIDDLSGGYYENVNPKIEEFRVLNLVTGDLENCFNEHKFDYVYHFAAYAAEGLSPFIRKYNYENNLIATTRIINQCIKHDVKRLVFTSTMAPTPASSTLAYTAPLALERANWVWLSNKGLLHCTVKLP